MSFLSAVSLRFSVCSSYSLPLTSGRQQESEAGDGKRRRAETWWAAGMAQDHRTHRSLARHSACLPMSISPLEAHHRHTLLLHPWLLPWQPFVFQRSLSEEDRLSQSSNHPFYRTNTHTHAHIIQTMLPYPTPTFFFFSSFGNIRNSNTFGVSCVE